MSRYPYISRPILLPLVYSILSSRLNIPLPFISHHQHKNSRKSSFIYLQELPYIVLNFHHKKTFRASKIRNYQSWKLFPFIQLHFHFLNATVPWGTFICIENLKILFFSNFWPCLWLEWHVAARSVDQSRWFQWQGLNFSLKKDVTLVLVIEIQTLGEFLSTSPVLCYVSVFLLQNDWYNNGCLSKQFVKLDGNSWRKSAVLHCSYFCSS